MSSVPRHIALIMDGNGRWARARGLRRTRGHEAASKRVRGLVEQCIQSNVEALTLYAFSSENWKRPKLEVSALMRLFSNHLKSEVPELHKQGVQLKVVGDRSRLSKGLQKSIHEAEELTANNSTLSFRLAINYGGRWEILEAAKKMAQSYKNEELSLDEFTDESFNQASCFGDVPEPDLLIRTSGEHRLSNFMLWSLAYAEFYFPTCFFPDFDETEFHKALECFAGRKRRFGAV